MRTDINIPEEFRKDAQAIVKECMDVFTSSAEENFSGSLERLHSVMDAVIVPMVFGRLVVKYQEEIERDREEVNRNARALARKATLAAIDAILGLEDASA